MCVGQREVFTGLLLCFESLSHYTACEQLFSKAASSFGGFLADENVGVKGEGENMKKLLCACFVMALGLCVASRAWGQRSEEHTSELQSRVELVCRLLLEQKKHVRC